MLMILKSIPCIFYKISIFPQRKKIKNCILDYSICRRFIKIIKNYEILYIITF
jgi:hypothetical protein